MPSLLRRLFPFFGRKEKLKELWPISTTPASSPSPRCTNIPSSTALRQNLRVKCGFDEAKVDRLIELERSLNPKAFTDTLMEAAIERWERENR